MVKSVGIRKEREEGNYFLKLQIFTSFLKNICFSELLNGVHLSSIANQKDREKAFFSKKEKKTKPLFTIPEEIVSDNELQSVNLKFLAFEMV